LRVVPLRCSKPFTAHCIDAYLEVHDAQEVLYLMQAVNDRMKWLAVPLPRHNIPILSVLNEYAWLRSGEAVQVPGVL
jgi:hypothetical protein